MVSKLKDVKDLINYEVMETGEVAEEISFKPKRSFSNPPENIIQSMNIAEYLEANKETDKIKHKSLCNFSNLFIQQRKYFQGGRKLV